MQLHMIGVGITVRLEDGAVVKGWLWRQYDDGSLLVSLDRRGDEIRVVPKRRWMQASFHHDDKADFAVREAEGIEKAIESIDRRYGRDILGRLRAIDTVRLSHLTERAQQLRDALRDLEYDANDIEQFIETRDDIAVCREARTDEAVRLSRHMLTELERVALLDLIVEAATELRTLPPEYTLPAADRIMLEHDATTAGRSKHADISPARERLDISTLRQRIEGYELDRAEFVSGVVARRGAPVADVPLKAERRGRLPRWIGATVRVVSGVGLTGFNGLVAVPAGITGSIMTIGGTTIPTAVGVAASIAAGLKEMAEGLEKIGDLMKEAAECDATRKHSDRA